MMSTAKNNYGVNIILYPRAYNKRGGESLHSVQGMTSDGRIVNVKLRLSDEAMQRDNYPSILEFSRTDAKALQSCFSTPENSPDNREGVLLFSQATSDGVNTQGMESYVAKWANVLAQQSESPEPIVGLGRVDIKKNATLIKSLKEKLSIAKEGNDKDAISKIKHEISNPKNFSFSLINYHYESIVSEQSSQMDKLKNKIIKAFANNKIHGAVPGFFIRAVNEEGRIIFGSYLEYFAKYNNLEEKYQSIVEMIDYFIESIEPSLDFDYFNQSSMTIEVCPLSKIITGRVGKKHFGQDYKYSFLKRMFYSKSDEGDVETSDPMLCNLAAKITIYDDKSLLSRVYPISHQLGDPRRLDRHGRFTKIFDGEDAKLSQRPVSNDELTPREIGCSYLEIPHRSTWIINGEYAPVSSTEVADTTPPVESSVETTEATPLVESAAETTEVTPLVESAVETTEATPLVESAVETTEIIQTNEPMDLNEHERTRNHNEDGDQKDNEKPSDLLNIPLREIESDSNFNKSRHKSNDFPEIDSVEINDSELKEESPNKYPSEPTQGDSSNSDRNSNSLDDKVATEASQEELERVNGPVEITQRWNDQDVSPAVSCKEVLDEKDKESDKSTVETKKSSNSPDKKLTGMAAFMKRKKIMK